MKSTALRSAYRELSTRRLILRAPQAQDAPARVLEKAGLQREDLLNAYAVHPNISPDPRDCLLYTKTRSVA
jgi:hypothetical protein